MKRDREDLADGIASELRRNVAPRLAHLGGGPVCVELTRARRGSTSSLYDVELIGRDGRQALVVKASEDAGGARAEPDRESAGAEDAPRIGQRTDARRTLCYEYRALSAIHEHFTALGDPRFGTVRVFELLPEGGAIAIERLAVPTLRTRVLREIWRPRAAAGRSLLAALRNTGAWLRMFHALPRLEHAVARHTKRSELVDSLEEFAGYLLDAGGEASFLREVAAETGETAARILPESLPAGMGHGDYAPRNVLVGPRERVVVIDTPGRWWFPIYQDLGYFLTALETLAPRVLTQGLVPGRAKAAALEQAFLRGYFGSERVPRAEVRLFEIQTLLSRWVSAVDPHRRARGASGIAERPAISLRKRFYKRCIEVALEALRRGAAGGAVR